MTTLAEVTSESDLLERAKASSTHRAETQRTLIRWGVRPLRAAELVCWGPSLDPSPVVPLADDAAALTDGYPKGESLT